MISELPKILIVDDIHANIVAMQKILSKVVAKLYSAISGDEALALCVEHDFAIALVDVNMPRISGFQLAEMLHSVQHTKSLPIIFVTAAEMDDYQSIKGYLVGAVDFVRKPIDDRILLSKVEVFLELFNKRRDIELSASLLQEKNIQLEYEIQQRHLAEEKIHHAYAARLAISQMLETTIKPLSIAEQVDAVFEILFNVSWILSLRKGILFLADKSSEMMVPAGYRGSIAQHELTQFQDNGGHCCCGEPFSDWNDHSCHVLHNKNGYDTHYGMPLLNQDGVMGVLCLYVETGHKTHEEEKEFFLSVTQTLIGIIERRKLEGQLRQQAQFDELTGLPNRVLFHDRLSQSLKYAKRTGKNVVLMFLDLDRFKMVNDTMGHEAGDSLLKEAAKRIASCIRDSDTVARLGGDEFTIILQQLTHPFYIEFVARKILEQLEAPFLLPQGQATISGSIGISCFPDDALDMETLTKYADSAMYEAKTAGRSTFRFFTHEMNTCIMERHNLEESLRQGISRDELILHYQPRLDIKTGRMTAMEALVRWNRPDHGLVPPMNFIPLAEETGLIVPLGLWVLETACRQNKIWQDKGFSPLVVSVNLSFVQFKHNTDLIQSVRDILKKTQLEPQWLELEITESMIMDNMDNAVATMKGLKAMGIRISLDDFGTGYSSLAVLRRFPLYALKIDKSFISEIPQVSEDAEIVSVIISMAKRLKLHVVAEGVETQEQFEFLTRNECDEIQGFFYRKPMPMDALREHLAES